VVYTHENLKQALGRPARRELLSVKDSPVWANENLLD
jgi:hypothetical protein